MPDYSPHPIRFDHVADLYDSYVRTEFDLSFWLKEAQAVDGKVLELTCGTGRISIPLLKAGIDLTCVDYAPGMLAVLRGKLEANGLTCPIYCQDMAELELPEFFSLIFIPFHSLSEVLEKKRHHLVLRRIHKHLIEGGIFICTLQNPAVRTISMNGSPTVVGKFPMEDGNTLVVQSLLTYDESTQIASGEQEYDVLANDGSLVDRRSLNMNFYLFRKSEFESLVIETGFEVLALYGDYDYRPFDEAKSPSMIWKLKKTAR
jgi:SAM-dependent methyltransferase